MIRTRSIPQSEKPRFGRPCRQRQQTDHDQTRINIRGLNLDAKASNLQFFHDEISIFTMETLSHSDGCWPNHRHRMSTRGRAAPRPPAPYSIHQSSSPRRHMHGIAVCAPRAHRAKKNSRIPQERVPRRFFLSRLRARCPAHSPAHMAPKQQLPEGGNAPPKTTAHTRQQSTEPRARGATDDLSHPHHP